MAKLAVEDLPLEGKKVLMRVDFNVPIKDGVVGDDNRIVVALLTIKYATDHGGRAVSPSHLDRIKEEGGKPGLSLRPVAKRLSNLLDKPVTLVPVTEGKQLEDVIDNIKNGDVLLIQNTRYEDVKDGEYVKRGSGNDPELGKYWASLGDVFVNGVSSTAHRKHASSVGIATNMPGKATAGYLMEKEIRFLGDAVDNPERPFVAILGGAKVSDKIGVIDNLLGKVDKITIDGGMAYTFYAAKGIKVGNSLVEKDKIDVAEQILDKAGDRLVLPINNVVADKFSNDADTKVAEGDIDDGWMALDIGPKSVEEFKNVLKDAKTVAWNGPVGVLEVPNFVKGTLEVGKLLGILTDATTIVGGGDSTATVKELGVADKLTHISTGGGASLTHLEDKELPGITAISDK